jgi:hypothetical protein
VIAVARDTLGPAGGVIVFFAAVLAAQAQPAAPDVFYGSTAGTAIVLPGIADEFHGVVAEHAYIADHFPAWHIAYQSHLAQNGRDYDIIGMTKPDRTKVAIFFDITEWFGK